MTHNAADRQNILDALSKYTWGYDEGDFELLADAFTKEAQSGGRVSGTDMKWGPMDGREQIVSILKDIRKTQTDQRRHNVSNFLFSKQTETEASFRCNLSLVGTEDGVSKVISGGYYDIDAVKQGNVWRMTRLDGVLDAPF